jgi:hypothetical protein
MVDSSGSNSPPRGVKIELPADGSLPEFLNRTGKPIPPPVAEEGANGGNGIEAPVPAVAPSEFDIAAVRARAWRLGYRLHRRGDEFHLIDANGGAISTGTLDGVARHLDAIEAERAETGDPITILRKELRAAGYSPVPVLGKQVLLDEWPTKHQVDDAELERWRRKHADHVSTGLLTRTTPALDVDIMNPEASAAVEQFLRAHFEGRGKVLRRVGMAPKFAMPFRTDEPFAKITGRLEEDSKGDKLEFLGDGQQFVAFGRHPDTGKDYEWFGGSPGEVQNAELPAITGEEARLLVIELQELVKPFGYTPQGEPQERAAPADSGDKELEIPNIGLVGAALNAIRATDRDRDFCIRVGHAAHYATNGSLEGLELFDKWRQGAPGYSNSRKVTKKWNGFRKSQRPEGKEARFGSLHRLADADTPGWRAEYEMAGVGADIASMRGEALATPEQESPKPAAEESKADAKPAEKPKLMQSSKEFVAGFVPPDYLIDGLLQRRYVYSLTGPTGDGKTAVGCAWLPMSPKV